jgi:C4-dicarboxylate-specific signal transduction histidine kinase
LNPPLESISKFGAIARPGEHLDLATAIKVSQSVSGEVVLEKLIDTLMRNAIEQAGAERGLLIRPRGVEQRLEAEATTSGGSVIVQLRDEEAGAAALPESVLHYVLRTGDSVILDDAAAQSAFAEDPYIRERQTRSILCVPLINQGKPNGVIYLENNLTHSAFAPARTAVLKLLASQAAIALENTTLSQALRDSEQRFRDYAETASDWYWETDADHKVIRMKDYEQLRALGRLPVTSRIGLARWDFAEDLESQPEKWELHRSMLEARQPFRDFVYPAVRFDGTLTYVKVSGKPYFDTKGNFLGYRGTGNDVDAAVRADQAEAALRQVQAELVHLARVTTLGELVGSIAHEVNQPIAATATNAQAALRWLRIDPPNLDEVRRTLERIVTNAARAGEVVQRIRNLVNKAPLRNDSVDINAAIREVIELTRSEAMKNGVLVRTELADSVPLVRGDRVELQQVILNLIINAVEAMSALTEGPRELEIVTSKTDSDQALIAVRDTGPGLAPAAEENLFKAFHTTKPNGLGLGLSICRSIVESRGGRMWASANTPLGAVFQFTLPLHPETAT